MVSYRDWVVETSSTTGTGTYSLSGSPPAGTSYFTFRQRYSNGDDEVCYWVVSADRTKWEKNRFGTLTYGSPDTLSRNVIESTNGDAPVSWVGGDGPLRIYVVPDADAEEFSISMGLGSSRPDVLKYGLWADENGSSTDFDAIKLYDGTNEDVIGVVNRDGGLATIYGLPPGYIQGLTLSRPSTTTITVAAGIIMDSTNVVGIKLTSAITKSSAGSWVAGTGNNGMGVGLTIANSTWYHVFAILVAGVAGVYFDTSITAANKPVGTTHFAFIESVKTNGSAQFIDFINIGNKIVWLTPGVDMNAASSGSSAVTRTLPSVPPGRVVEPILAVTIDLTGAVSEDVYLSALAQTDVAVTGDNAQVSLSAPSSMRVAAMVYGVFTNTSAQIRSRQSQGGANQTVRVKVHGWIDPRARNA